MDPVTTDEIEAVREGLKDALRATLDLADRGVSNLPEFLTSALVQMATEAGGSDRVLEHRPGSWEAAAVARLLDGGGCPSVSS